jgi:hypothetical protein
MNKSFSGPMASGAMMSEAPDYYRQNERYLLDIIKTQLGITDEDMESPSIVKAKVRDAKIDKVLDSDSSN